ncbi:MAG: hypothetical protein KA166_03670 [Saprospiraceae bacterium]|nr:hypothetical protein [Saprospiraceae bacterium]
MKIQKVEVGKAKLWLALTPSGDTAVQLMEKQIELTLLPQDMFNRHYDYFEMGFNDSDTIGFTSQYSVGGANQFADRLLAAGCFSDGQYKGECAEFFIRNNSDWSKEKMASILEANVWRDSLLHDEAYLKYSATLPKRNSSLPIEIAADSSIMVFNVRIGKYQVPDLGSMSMSFRVLNHKNRPFASINYEYGRKRIFIRTFDDNKGKEYFLNHVLTQQDINDAIAYLVDYGYL